MQKKYYILSLLLAGFYSGSIAQNCSTPQLEAPFLCLPGNYAFETHSGKIAVYNTADTSVIGISSSVTVSPVATTSYLYAQTEQIGPADHTIGAGDFYTTIDKHVAFEASSAFIINTVDVYPKDPGDITIRLVQMTGGFMGIGATENLIASRTVTVSSGGMQTIHLGLSVPQGSNYRLVLTSESCGGLFRNSSGQAFPYTSSSGAAKITGGDYDIMGYYYYFYNWNITPVVCIRLLEIGVGTAPSATVLSTSNSLQAAESGMSYQWMDCVSGNPIAGAVSQQFTPVSEGQYAVVVSDAGCSTTSDCIDFTAGTTGLAGINGHSVRIYPNPATDRLFIETDELISTIRITDHKGVTVLNDYTTATVDLSTLTSGIYFLEISNQKGETFISKVVKR